MAKAMLVSSAILPLHPLLSLLTIRSFLPRRYRGEKGDDSGDGGADMADDSRGNLRSHKTQVSEPPLCCYLRSGMYADVERAVWQREQCGREILVRCRKGKVLRLIR